MRAKITGNEKNRPTLKLLEGGNVQKADSGGYYWSGNMLIDNNKNEARRLASRTYKGVELLLVEEGGFAKADDPDVGIKIVPPPFSAAPTSFEAKLQQEIKSSALGLKRSRCACRG